MLVLSAAAVIVATMATTTRGRTAAIVLVVLPWLGGGILSMVGWTEAAGQSVRASIIQAGVSQDKKWAPEYRVPIMQHYREATASVADSDIVLWPEVAIPALDDQVESFIADVESMARANSQTVLFGILERSYDRDVEGRNAEVADSMLTPAIVE